jgi:colanic acid biosynthesis glycosyl transferase WcaI
LQKRQTKGIYFILFQEFSLVTFFTLISPNYAPEDTAIGLYNTQMIDFFVEHGYKTSVVTAFPYYPAWKISDNYLNKPTFYSEKRTLIDHADNPVAIYRYRQYVPAKPSFLKRILHLVDFTFGSFINLFKIKQADIVFTVVPFTTTPLLGLILAKLRGAVLWVHIQDFEFDAAVESGIAQGKLSFLFKILFKIEKYLLSKADFVSSISYAMCQKITDKTGRNDTYYLPNWIDAHDINPQTAKKHDYLTHHSDKFTVLYSGNMGAKQDWDIFIQTVKSLNDNPKIHFVVVGDGAMRDTVINATKDLNNISFYPPVAFNVLGDLLCSADLHILCQKTDVVDTVMPSKILGMFASQKPSLVTGNEKSEVATLFHKANAGYFIADNNVDTITKSIIECSENKEKAEQFGHNARTYILDNFSREAILQKLMDTLKKID